MKQSKQIVNSNFTTVVLELEQAIKEGYSVVTNEVARPYHAILGNFYITVEKDVDEEVCNPVFETDGDIPTEVNTDKTTSVEGEVCNPVYETTGDSPTEVNTEVNTEVSAETNELVAEESEAKVVQTPAPKNARKAK